MELLIRLTKRLRLRSTAVLNAHGGDFKARASMYRRGMGQNTWKNHRRRLGYGWAEWWEQSKSQAVKSGPQRPDAMLSRRIQAKDLCWRPGPVIWPSKAWESMPGRSSELWEEEEEGKPSFPGQTPLGQPLGILHRPDSCGHSFGYVGGLSANWPGA
ncbi:unnamed protein product [Clonostachys rhizophaga]|uniref:Uncharacterized protein n=1 Tax=Clonostachys rhizophaga TaxID=160324 RepID=A0A9N9YE62_9HYPO|nr:unnamed protein product [Clonostachys rhizophaga]